MTIRDRVRRVLRRSDSSDTISQTESSSTITTSTSASSLHKSTGSSGNGKMARTLTWIRRSKDEAKNESDSAKENKKNKKMHPSQRPLTLQNLKHQEMLSRFTMTFGASDPDQIESLSFVGISPCCTRAPSLMIDRADNTCSSTLTGSPNPDSDRD